jgi:hypothetical protein
VEGDVVQVLPDPAADLEQPKAQGPKLEVRDLEPSQPAADGVEQPAETTITGELRPIEGGIETGRGEAEPTRLRHGTSPGEAWLTLQPTPLLRCPVSS